MPTNTEPSQAPVPPAPAAPNPYLKTKIMTAGPEELRLILYDGAVRFCQQARAALEGNNFDSSYNFLMRAQKIVLELSTSLNHQVDPDLCARLSALYTYIYRRLVDANVKHELAAVDEAIKLLSFERETWQLLMKQTAARTGPTGGVANAQQTAISSLHLNG